MEPLLGARASAGPVSTMERLGGAVGALGGVVGVRVARSRRGNRHATSPSLPPLNRTHDSLQPLTPLAPSPTAIGRRSNRPLTSCRWVPRGARAG